MKYLPRIGLFQAVDETDDDVGAAGGLSAAVDNSNRSGEGRKRTRRSRFSESNQAQS